MSSDGRSSRAMRWINNVIDEVQVNSKNLSWGLVGNVTITVNTSSYIPAASTTASTTTTSGVMYTTSSNDVISTKHQHGFDSEGVSKNIIYTHNTSMINGIHHENIIYENDIQYDDMNPIIYTLNTVKDDISIYDIYD